MTRTLRSFPTFAFLLAIALVATSVAPSLAHAGPTEDARALELKTRGDAAFDAGRPADALQAYVEAYRLSKDPALLYNKGRAFQALTDYPHALEELEAFDREAPAELKQRVRALPRIIEEVRSKVTRLSIQCPAGATIRLRDRTLAACPTSGPIAVNAGPATLEVTKDGHERWARDVNLPGAGTASFDVVLVPKAQQESPSVLTRWWFWTGALVVVGGGVALGIALTSERDPREGTVPPGVVSGGLHGAGFRF